MALKLNKLDKFAGRKGPLLVIVMDGVGIGKLDDSDAVFLAKTPVLDKLWNMHIRIGHLPNWLRN